MNIKFNQWLVPAGLLAASTSFAGGFEKVIMFSGKHAGTAGAAVSSVKGSDSLYFNPAGLAAGESEQKWDVTANFSPTFPKFSGPVTHDSVTKESSRPLVPIAALATSYRATPDLSVGLGLFSTGGSKTSFTVDPVAAAAQYSRIGNRDIKVDLKILEIALGAGYKLTPEWSVGAAWRVSKVSADFATFDQHPVSFNAGALSYINLHDLKDTSYNGFRIGTEYRNTDNSWGIGANFRSTVDFTAKGKANGAADAVTSLMTFTDGDASASSSLPMQLSLGGDYALNDHWRAFLEGSMTQYSHNKYLKIDGHMLTAANTKQAITKNLVLAWHDLYVVRVGTEYTGLENWVLRGGYIYNTAVTNKHYARATFIAPGSGHTFIVGTGTSFLNKNLDVDAALEYGMASATVNVGEGVAGKYKTNAYALHLGSTYRF